MLVLDPLSFGMWSVVAERSSLPDSSSGSNVGSNPGRDTCVLEQDT